MHKQYVAALIVLFTVAGCGGGGGGGQNSSGGITTEPLILTQDDAAPIAAQVLDAALSVPPFAGAPLSPVQMQQVPDLLILASATRMMLGAVNATTPSPGVPFDLTLPCDGGGNFRAVGTASASSRLETGDVVALTPNDCKGTAASFAYALTGTLKVTKLAVTTTATLVPGGQPPGRWQFDGSYSAGTIQAVNMRSAIAMVVEHTIASATDESIVASGSSLFGFSLSGTETNMTSFTQTIHRVGSTFSTSLDAEVSDYTRYVGNRTFSIRTIVPLQWTGGAQAPNAGSIFLIGASSNTLRADISPTGIQLWLNAGPTGQTGQMLPPTTYAALHAL